MKKPVLNWKEFGKGMKENRVELGLSIRAASKKIKISPATLLRLERGRTPDFNTFLTVCKWLEIDPSRMIGVITK